MAGRKDRSSAGRVNGRNASWTREILAVGIIILSVAGISVFAGIAIGQAEPAEQLETSRMVFTSVLPLFGTWVGTVLAFYFARENLAAATASAERLTGISLRSSVADIMIRMDRAVVKRLPAGNDGKDVLLSELLGMMTAVGFHRIPIVSDKGAVLFVIHDATIYSYAGTQNKDVGSGQSTENVGNLVDSPTYGPMIMSVGFVDVGATVADARMELDRIRGCNDVFVTRGGKPDGEAVGWLTNTDLAGIPAG